MKGEGGGCKRGKRGRERRAKGWVKGKKKKRGKDKMGKGEKTKTTQRPKIDRGSSPFLSSRKRRERQQGTRGRIL